MLNGFLQKPFFEKKKKCLENLKKKLHRNAEKKVKHHLMLREPQKYLFNLILFGLRDVRECLKFLNLLKWVRSHFINLPVAEINQ